MYNIRQAVPTDGAAVAEIYAPYVRDTAVSFEEVPPDAAEMSRRIIGISRHLPYFVACLGDTVVGYAYASPFGERAAYCKSVYCSIYVRDGFHRCGVATALYNRLFPALEEQGIYNVYASITVPNEGSIALHSAFGFSHCTVFEGIGYKHGQWLDVCYMHLRLHPDEAKPASR